MLRDDPWNLGISWHSQMSKKKALQTYQTLAHNLFELPCAQKGSVSRNWCSASLLFHPSSSRPWLTSSLPSVTSKNWKKNFALLGKSHLGTRKTQQNDRMYLHTFSTTFSIHSHPPCRTPFPFPSDILLKSLLEHRLDALLNYGCIFLQGAEMVTCWVPSSWSHHSHHPSYPWQVLNSCSSGRLEKVSWQETSSQLACLLLVCSRSACRASSSSLCFPRS